MGKNTPPPSQFLAYDWERVWPNIGPPQTQEAFDFAQRWPTALAQAWNRTRPNTTGAETYNNTAYDGVLHASYIARQYGPWGPNLASGETPPVQGSAAQAFWLQGIASIRNRLPGRP